LQFHWLKRSGLKPWTSVGDDFLQEAGLAGDAGVIWGQGELLINSGEIFTVSAQDSDHLPSFELLQLQWDLHRVAAICGAAEVTDDEVWIYLLDSDVEEYWLELDEDSD
jgi:hypothetical protein